MAEDKNRKPSTMSGRRTSVAEEPVTSVLGPNQVVVFDRELTADEETLAALGYKYVDVSITVNHTDVPPDPNSNVNFHYGRHFASPLPSSDYCPRSLPQCISVWATLVQLVWCGVGS